jgi:hypothetical protein
MLLKLKCDYQSKRSKNNQQKMVSNKYVNQANSLLLQN